MTLIYFEILGEQYAVRGAKCHASQVKMLIVLVFVSQDDPYMFRKPETRCL